MNREEIYKKADDLIKQQKSKQLNKPVVSGRISVCMGRNDSYRAINSNSNFFADADYFLLKEDGECLTITKHRMEIPKKAQKVRKTEYGYYFQFASELPCGKFEFDADESNEDVARIYYR